MSKKKLRKTKSRKNVPDQRSQICICVDNYDVSVSAGINRDLSAPEYAFNLDERDPVYEFETRLVISGTATDPKARVGHVFELTIYGDEAPSKGLDLTLKDMRARGQYGAPEYRRYRKREIPVYWDVKGMALLNKVTGEEYWTA